MITKSTLLTFAALALTVSMTTDAFAGSRHSRGHSWPIFGSSRSCCVVVNPCAPAVTAPAAPATAAAPGTYRSFSYEPSAPAPVYVAPAPRRTPSYMLPKTDPRRYSGDR